MDRKAADLRDKTLLAFEPDAEGAAISDHRRGEGRRSLDGYSLKPPQAEVELTMADGTRLPALFFGKAERDRLYTKVATASAVYAIDPNF
jgi:hypothetical protein